MRTQTSSLTLTALFLPAALSSAISANTNDVYQLDDVIVTASRTAQTVDQALAPVSVITREDIETSQATSVPDLLNTLPGVQIRTSGGPGSEASISIRGTNNNESLVLVDGQRIGSATVGGASLQYFSPEQIERIEVVRGPISSLYGADAIGGVVNIITRKGSAKPTATIKAGYGSRNTRELSVFASGGNDVIRIAAGVNAFDTDGYDSTEQEHGTDSDNDGYKNVSGNLNIRHKFTDKDTLSVSFLQSEGESEYDTTSSSTPVNKPYYEFKQQAVSGKYEHIFNDTWTTSLTAGYNQNYQNAKDSPYGRSKFDTRRHSYNWLNTVATSENSLLIAGVDYYKDRVISSTDFDVTSRDNKAVFAEQQINFNTYDLRVNLRQDDNEVYGKETTGGFAFGKSFESDIRVVASWGKAFKAPTFQDLYNVFASNPDVKPEKSYNTELSVSGKNIAGLRVDWSVNAFENRIDDKISLNPAQNHRAENISKAKIKGLEFALGTKLSNWNLQANLSLLDPVNEDTNQQLRRIAKQRLVVDVSRQLGRYTFGGIMRAQSHSWDKDAPKNTDRVDGFATFDLRASTQLAKEWKADLKLVNLLNKDYQTSYGYNEEPRGAFVSVSWSPDI
ncbi:TonB-dependent receptor [Parendozoicomonas sp. Alg238-R29]|uniref:TonB-dependent receptor domain-containing protein n=1 Tax=Parendozoicomonas sp. Alg238-R29 TaxID=2993446 RepID=UPI00248DB9C8|nr:TonB-dependent receptor [Parendozoicomonas sp. Alg238-R29]